MKLWPCTRRHTDRSDGSREELVSELARALIAASPMQGAPRSIPTAKSPYPAYHWDTPIVWSTPQPPKKRPRSFVSLDTLREVADQYDVLRACIQHLKREVAAVPLEIVPREARDDSAETQRECAMAEEFLSTRGGLGGVGRMRQEFEGMVVEDLCTIGQAALFYWPSYGGLPYEVFALDAATFRPRVDAYGWPGPGEDWWEQWIYGVLVSSYPPQQVGLFGLHTNARSWTPYFASPVEWLLNCANSALRADEWNRSWLTDGNLPDVLLGAPPDWTPDQIRSFADYFDAILAGDSRQRRKAKIVPGGTSLVQPHSRADQDFQQFELWLLRRCCAVMGVQPASIGFAGEQYKVSQSDSMESTSVFGVGVLLDFRKTIYDDLWHRMGWTRITTRNVPQREARALERAQRNAQLVAAGIKTPNEARQDEGLDPRDGGDVLYAPAAPVGV